MLMCALTVFKRNFHQLFTETVRTERVPYQERWMPIMQICSPVRPEEVLSIGTKVPHDVINKRSERVCDTTSRIVQPVLMAVLLSRNWDSRTRTRTWKLVLEDPRGQGLSSRTATLVNDAGAPPPRVRHHCCQLHWQRVRLHSARVVVCR